MPVRGRRQQTVSGQTVILQFRPAMQTLTGSESQNATTSETPDSSNASNASSTHADGAAPVEEEARSATLPELSGETECQRLAEAFMCNICFGLADPQHLEVFLCCSRLCCRTCADGHFARARGTACPCCRREIPGERKALSENQVHLRLANEIHVRCGSGCGWTGGLGDFWKEHVVRCASAVVLCRLGCGKLCSGSELRTHELGCGTPAYTCEICASAFRSRRALEDHMGDAAGLHVGILRKKCETFAERESAVAPLLNSLVTEVAQLRSAVEESVRSWTSTEGGRCSWMIRGCEAWESVESETGAACLSCGPGLWWHIEKVTDPLAPEKLRCWLCSDEALCLKQIRLRVSGQGWFLKCHGGISTGGDASLRLPSPVYLHDSLIYPEIMTESHTSGEEQPAEAEEESSSNVEEVNRSAVPLIFWHPVASNQRSSNSTSAASLPCCYVTLEVGAVFVL